MCIYFETPVHILTLTADFEISTKNTQIEMSEFSSETENWPTVQILEVAIGTAGILSNAFSLCHNFRRKGFPRQLYIILNTIDMSVCGLGILYKLHKFEWKESFIIVNHYALANQASALWTCIIGGARLLAMSRPFYQINKPVFWTISTMLLAIGTIPQMTMSIVLSNK